MPESGKTDQSVDEMKEVFKTPLHYNCVPFQSNSFYEHQIVDANNVWLIGRVCTMNSTDNERTGKIFKFLIELANSGAAAE